MVEDVPVVPEGEEVQEYELPATAVDPSVTELPKHTELILPTFANGKEAVANCEPAPVLFGLPGVGKLGGLGSLTVC